MQNLDNLWLHKKSFKTNIQENEKRWFYDFDNIIENRVGKVLKTWDITQLHDFTQYTKKEIDEIITANWTFNDSSILIEELHINGELHFDGLSHIYMNNNSINDIAYLTFNSNSLLQINDVNKPITINSSTEENVLATNASVYNFITASSGLNINGQFVFRKGFYLKDYLDNNIEFQQGYNSTNGGLIAAIDNAPDTSIVSAKAITNYINNRIDAEKLIIFKPPIIINSSDTYIVDPNETKIILDASNNNINFTIDSLLLGYNYSIKSINNSINDVTFISSSKSIYYNDVPMTLPYTFRPGEAIEFIINGQNIYIISSFPDKESYTTVQTNFTVTKDITFIDPILTLDNLTITLPTTVNDLTEYEFFFGGNITEGTVVNIIVFNTSFTVLGQIQSPIVAGDNFKLLFKGNNWYIKQ